MGGLSSDIHYNVLRRERSFFGTLRVRLDRDSKQLVLVHGNTMHGAQSLDPARRHEPLAYYHPSGPIGQVFEALRAQGSRPPIAFIGLGIGTLAAYGAPDQQLTFYEIDPAVQHLARDPEYFTYLRDAEDRGVQLKVVLGDARLKMEQAADKQYGLIVIDAFSSDAIPIHLLTREAFHLYLSKLTGDGLLAFHISSRSLDLEPVVGALAQDTGLVGLVQRDEALKKLGKASSDWVVLARKPADLGGLARDARWKLLSGGRHVAVWTDDFSNVLGVVRWRRTVLSILAF
jgi:hypothetical protein